MANAQNVIAGSAILYIAPTGTALPTLTTLPSAAAWASASFTQPGYTDKGVEFIYTPTFKNIDVDEEMSPVNQLLTAEKAEIKVALAEATLANLAISIPGSAITTAGGISTLKFGSPAQTAVTEYILAFQGPSPAGNADTCVLILYRVKNIAAVTVHYQRADKVVYQVTFNALADSTKAAGQRVGRVDYYPAHS